MVNDKDAPSCADKDGLHCEEVNYPRIDNMNPRSYGKIQSAMTHNYVYASPATMPKASINPERNKYVGDNVLKSMKLVK